MNWHYVLVYGTLRRNEVAHGLMQSVNAVFLKEFKSAPAFHRADHPDKLPWKAFAAGGEDSIEGELYRVDADYLHVLDRYEGHPDLFRRTVVGNDPAFGDVEAYLFNV